MVTILQHTAPGVGVYARQGLTSNPAELDSLQYPLEGYKYLGSMCKLTAFKAFSIFLFYVSVFGE